MYGPSQQTKCFLSVGTGIPVRVPLPDNMVVHPYNVMAALASIATNTEVVHVLFRTLIDTLAPHAGKPKYWRLNISKEIMKKVKEFLVCEKEVEVKMDDADEAARKAMIDAANEYMKANDQLIEECANAL